MVFMLRAVPDRAAGILSREVPIPAGSGDFAGAQLDFFVLQTGYLTKRLSWRPRIEKNRNRSARRGLRKGIGGENRLQLPGCANSDADRFSRIRLQPRFQCCLDLGFGFAAFKNDVAAGDVGANVSKTQLFAQDL